MREVPAKVGTIPMIIDLRRKRRVKVGDRVEWRDHFEHSRYKWNTGRVTRVRGDSAKPVHIFLDRL